MLRIAIVDDKTSDADRLKGAISASPLFEVEKPIIDFYSRGLDFLDNYSKNYDAVFMDIDMPVINGLETSEKLRVLDKQIDIVFVTNYASLAINGYSVSAIDFLVKPVTNEAVESCLAKILKHYEERNGEKLVIRIKHGYKAIAVSDIYYIEVIKHDLTFHCSDGEFTTRMPMKEIEAKLSHGFCKCSNSYLVNLSAIDSVVGDTVIVPGGDKLPIARGKKKEFIEAFVSHIG